MLFRTRKAVLIIHGFLGGTYDQEELANYLELDNNLDVYRFTLPGHSRNLSKVKYQEWIDKSEEYVKRLIKNSYSDIYLIGHSMGGVIATYLASKYSQIKKLVLAAPSFNYLGTVEDNVDLKKTLVSSSNIIKTYGTDEVLSRFLKLNSAMIFEFMELVKKYYDYPYEITCPILILQGNNDDLANPSSSRYVYDSVKSRKKTLIYLDGVTHDVFKSKKDALVFKTVNRFLVFGYRPGVYYL